MKKFIAITTLIIALLLINWSIYQKEVLLENGQVVYLKLAPVDPRSIMQGDYMTLRFTLAGEIQSAFRKQSLLEGRSEGVNSFDGLVNVSVNERSIASFVSISTQSGFINHQANPANDELALKTLPLQFRLRKGRVKFATDAFFFEEGTGSKLTNATYGEFRVNEHGELLLVALCDEALTRLG